MTSPCQMESTERPWAIDGTGSGMNREAIAASMAGDRAPIAAVLPDARAAVTEGAPDAELAWALARLEQFHRDEERLSDADAARLLIGLENTDIRDVLWDDLTLDNAASHRALWHDLTRRAPDEVRTPAAALLGFASWLEGDVPRAWCALEQAPDGQHHTIALTLMTALETGTDPQQWARIRALIDTSGTDKAFIPKPRGETPTT